MVSPSFSHCCAAWFERVPLVILNSQIQTQYLRAISAVDGSRFRISGEVAVPWSVQSPDDRWSGCTWIVVMASPYWLLLMGHYIQEGGE